MCTLVRIQSPPPPTWYGAIISRSRQ